MRRAVGASCRLAGHKVTCGWREGWRRRSSVHVRHEDGVTLQVTQGAQGWRGAVVAAEPRVKRLSSEGVTAHAQSVLPRCEAVLLLVSARACCEGCRALSRGPVQRALVVMAASLHRAPGCAEVGCGSSGSVTSV